ncbi:MAG: glycerophosphodiester phosphodiesterase family protein [Acidobacteriota bacterium]
MQHAFLDHQGPVAIAHRGGALENVENTMAAFQHSVDLGYRFVETDVHATADGQLVAFHDDDLARITSGEHRGRIGELSYDQIRKIRLGDQHIPLLEEILDAWPDLRLTIDPKDDTAVEPLMEVLGRTDLDRICVGAFSDERIGRFHERFGERICLGLGPGAVRRLRFGFPHVAPGLVAQVPTQQWGIPLTDRFMLWKARRRGLALHVWTINRRQQMERLLDRGVDGVMTDAPALLKQVFEERGLW